MPFVFVVDDDEEILDSLKIWFTKKKYEVQTFLDGKHLVEEVLSQKPDLVMLDVKLQGMDGRSLCRDIKEAATYPVKILLSSADPSALLLYEYNYADGIINKPFHLIDLEKKCRRLLG